MAKIKQISINEYSKEYKQVSTSAIRKAVVKKKLYLLPNVLEADKIGRNYVLTVLQ
jgi:hypothetical protein